MQDSTQQEMERRYSRPYNWCVEPWHRMWRQKNGLWSLAHELVGSVQTLRILDVGCGDGWYTSRISEATKSAHGIDVSERAIRFAESINPNATFTVGSATNLPYEEGIFDLVMSFQVIEHINPTELPDVVSSVHRVLKKGGKLLITVPSVNRQLSRAHYQHFSLESLKKVFEPKFTLLDAVGQERHTLALHVIERMLHNRIWLLPSLAERFHRGAYLHRWNRTDVCSGQNIVALFERA